MGDLPLAIFSVDARVPTVDDVAPWEASQIDIRYLFGCGATENR